jgi:hypothetical protein
MAEVMEVGCRDQDLALIFWEDAGDPLGLSEDTSYVCPAVTSGASSSSA